MKTSLTHSRIELTLLLTELSHWDAKVLEDRFFQTPLGLLSMHYFKTPRILKQKIVSVSLWLKACRMIIEALEKMGAGKGTNGEAVPLARKLRFMDAMGLIGVSCRMWQGSVRVWEQPDVGEEGAFSPKVEYESQHAQIFERVVREFSSSGVNFDMINQALHLNLDDEEVLGNANVSKKKRPKVVPKSGFGLLETGPAEELIKDVLDRVYIKAGNDFQIRFGPRCPKRSRRGALMVTNAGSRRDAALKLLEKFPTNWEQQATLHSDRTR